MIELLLASMALALGGSFLMADEDDSDEDKEASGEGPNEISPETSGTNLLDDVELDYTVNSDNGVGNMISGTNAAEKFLVSIDDTVLGNDGDDTIDVLAGADIVDGGDGNDQIFLDDDSAGKTGGYVQFLGDGFDHIDEDEAAPELRGGDGDDLIKVESGFADIFAGEGDDTVDATGLDGGIIHANAGDVLLGSDVAGQDQIGVIAADGAQFRGGRADEAALAKGDGSRLDGGGGRDQLYSDAGSATLIGGDGDDTLISHADVSRYDESTRNTHFGQWIDSSKDVLDGGSGDDRLEISNGDIGTGGSGDDHFSIHYRFDEDAPTEQDLELGAPEVTDFVPGSDTATLKIDEGFDEWYIEGDPELDLSGRVDVSEENGDTLIRVDGELATTLKNVSGVKAGYSDKGSRDDIVDADSGIVGDRSEFDFVVEFFFAKST